MSHAPDKTAPVLLVVISARIKGVAMKNGVARISIDKPLDWPKENLFAQVTYRYASVFYIDVPEEKAARLKGKWLTCTAKWTPVRNSKDAGKLRKTFLS